MAEIDSQRSIQKLLMFPIWTPLSQMVEKVQSANLISDELYKLGSNFFLYVSPTNRVNPEEVRVGPFVVGVLWAESEGAAMRVIHRTIELDVAIPTAPPVFLCPPIEKCTYSSILKHIKDGKISYREYANYRVSDGLFVSKIIEYSNTQYYFRDPKHNSKATPYVICSLLSDNISS